MNSRTYTDFEQLAQAYVDGELVGDDRLEFEAYLAEDSSRWQYVREIEILKHQVRGAFPTTDTAPVRVQPERRYRLVAAALVVGIMAGWSTAWILPHDRTAENALEIVSEATTPRVLIHIASEAPETMNEALESARTILDHYATNAEDVRVHVVANGPGLNLLRAGSPFATHIGAMERRYSNVQFVACQNTINRLEEKLKRDVKLLPEVLRVDSGVADIARKRKDGWLYIGV